MEWICRSNKGGTRRTDKDVYIGRISNNRRVRIVFYNDTYFKGKRIALGVDGDKVYFTEDLKGYKVIEQANASSITLGEKFNGIMKGFDGPYDLKRDKYNNLYYIEGRR